MTFTRKETEMAFENFVQDGVEYTFVGNKDIVCKCLSNGQRCNQRNMDEILSNPWKGDFKSGKFCERVWKPV